MRRTTPERYEHYWMGSLAVGMRDASGQLYRRNRYYDPHTGQFTQKAPSASQHNRRFRANAGTAATA